MKQALPKWLNDAIARIRAETYFVTINCDEDIEKYKEHSEQPLRIGDTLLIRLVPELMPDAQRAIDDFQAREFLRNNPEYR